MTKINSTKNSKHLDDLECVFVLFLEDFHLFNESGVDNITCNQMFTMNQG